MTNKITLSGIVPDIAKGQRLDAALAKMFPEYSRERIKNWILNGECLVNNKILKPKDKVNGLEAVEIVATIPDANTWTADDDLKSKALEFVYQDEDILVINKPSNLVVHPGAGNIKGTLVNILLAKFPELVKVPRAGIVHRLDKNTTGLMVVAKSLVAHASLVKQLQAREIKRVYDAVVWGIRPAGGTVDLPIARHPKDRTKMAIVTTDSGRAAVSHFRIVEKFRHNMHIKVALETGRTHQIRVHMSHINLPLVGDKTYGRQRLLPKAEASVNNFLQGFSRQALHASHLGLTHPVNKNYLEWNVSLPLDIQELIRLLREDKEQASEE